MWVDWPCDIVGSTTQCLDYYNCRPGSTWQSGDGATVTYVVTQVKRFTQVYLYYTHVVTAHLSRYWFNVQPYTYEKDKEVKGRSQRAGKRAEPKDRARQSVSMMAWQPALWVATWFRSCFPFLGRQRAGYVNRKLSAWPAVSFPTAKRSKESVIMSYCLNFQHTVSRYLGID